LPLHVPSDSEFGPAKPRVDPVGYSPEETIGFLIWDTIRAFHRTFQKLISLHGVNFGMWPFLRALWVQDGLGIRELGQRVHMAAPTTLKAVVTLERAGFAYRRDDPNDSRKTLVYLTPEGRELFSRVLPDMQYVNRVAVKGMSKTEQAEVKRLLKKMRSNVATLSADEVQTTSSIARSGKPRPGRSNHAASSRD
jgi:MarR family transcriptional regulator for hemolysin